MSRISLDSRVQLCVLSIQKDGRDFTIGRADIGTFVSVPPEAVEIIKLMDGSHSLRDIHDTLEKILELDVDILDFANSMAKLRFIMAVDEQPIEDRTSETKSRFGHTSGTILFHRVATTIYVLMGVLSIVLVSVYPHLLPNYRDAFAVDSIGMNLLAFFCISWGLTCLHELGHMLAAARLGVNVKVRLSLRLFWLVAETDMTGLWGVPKNARYVPYLAGMFWDATLFTACSFLQLGLPEQLLVTKFLRLVGLSLGYRMVWQLLVFLRTDLYYILTTFFNATNLGANARLAIRSLLHILTRNQSEWTELQPGERIGAYVFACMTIIGYGAGVLLFLRFQLPATVYAVLLAVKSVLASPLSGTFWDGMISLGVMALQGILWLLGAITARRNGRAQHVEAEILS